MVELEVFVRLVPWVTIRVILLKIVLVLVLDCPKNWPLWLVIDFGALGVTSSGSGRGSC